MIKTKMLRKIVLIFYIQFSLSYFQLFYKFVFNKAYAFAFTLQLNGLKVLFTTNIHWRNEKP